MAMVAEVIAFDSSVRVERVTCAIDCGQVVSPATVRAQVEGSVAWVVGPTLFGEITVDGGPCSRGQLRQLSRPPDERDAPRRRAHRPQYEVPSGVGEPQCPRLRPPSSMRSTRPRPAGSTAADWSLAQRSSA